jgi:AraC family transcriptional regulator, regulatory protein of adaptative response / DNA-3-methyladenine glycosylase II
MNLSRAQMLQTMFSGDSSLDDVFTVAVKTTGIYCRPSCNPPRKPKPENVQFFNSPLEAKQAGFRACKLCRPDGISNLEIEQRIVKALTQNALNDPNMFEDVTDMANAANISVSRLYKLFKTHRGITPLEMLNRIRVQNACKRLDNQSSSISEIALEVGFQSLSAFNANFKRFMGTSPLEYRRTRSNIELRAA